MRVQFSVKSIITISAFIITIASNAEAQISNARVVPVAHVTCAGFTESSPLTIMEANVNLNYCMTYEGPRLTTGDCGDSPFVLLGFDSENRAGMFRLVTLLPEKDSVRICRAAVAIGGTDTGHIAAEVASEDCNHGLRADLKQPFTLTTQVGNVDANMFDTFTCRVEIRTR